MSQGSRRFGLAAAAAALLCASKAHAQGDLFFESAVAPRVEEFVSASVSSAFWHGHRFEITTPHHVSSAGAYFDGNEGKFSVVFVAIVALSGPTDVPDSFDLTTGDLLDTSTMTVGPGPGDYLAPFDLTLLPGWYLVLLGFDAFGAHVQSAVFGIGSRFTDNDSGHTLTLHRGSPTWIEQPDNEPARFLMAPEPGASATAVAAALALRALARRRARRC